MSEVVDRRRFLSRMWLAGSGLIAAAGAWTTWDFLQALPTTGFGGRVRSVTPEAVPEDGVIEVPAAKAYLTKVNGEITAIYEKCTHLGCRVPFCQSSGQFECPCHGSVFNRAGDFVAGPSPRGMDYFATDVDPDGFVYIDTAVRIDGLPPGEMQIDEPATGPACAAEGGH
jgi:cytochrome b6-f complex iron-sulfur subunit